MIYINDLRKASKLTQLLLCAAETGIFYFHSASNCLESVLNNELQNFDVCQNVINSRLILKTKQSITNRQTSKKTKDNSYCF